MGSTESGTPTINIHAMGGPRRADPFRITGAQTPPLMGCDEAPGSPLQAPAVVVAAWRKGEMRCFATGAIPSSRLKPGVAKILPLKNLSGRARAPVRLCAGLNRSNPLAFHNSEGAASPASRGPPPHVGGALWANQ